MEFRRSATGDQRRRRVLIEEKLSVVGGGEAVTIPERTLSGLTQRSYTDAALLALQPTTILVLAQRTWTIVVVLLVALTAIVGLEAAYGQVQLLPRAMGLGDLTALDVASPGSLAAWLSSLLLIAAAFQGLQIYRLRRHKVDDYRGRYRVWGWTPAVLFLTATSVATGLDRDLFLQLNRLTNGNRGLEHAGLPSLVASLVWIPIGVRLAFEVRRNRLALAFLLQSMGLYLAAGVLGLVRVESPGRLILVMTQSATAMLGHLAVYATLAIYGRHVYLDSQGMLLPSRRSARKTQSSVAQENPPEQEQAGPQEGIVEHAVPNDVISFQSAREIPSDAQAQHAQEEREEIEDAGGEKLSRAERRRQRKLKRHEQQRRAA